MLATHLQYRMYFSELFLADITLIGMEVGVLTMQKGELSRFLYSPAYAYGALGCPPLIPPSATVLFEVEMMDFLDTAVSDSFFVLSPVSDLCMKNKVVSNFKCHCHCTENLRL